MDSKLLLVKSITLLYKESLLSETTENSSQLIRQVLGHVRIPEALMETDPGRATIVALKSTSLWMCDNPPSHTYDRAILLQRIRVNVGEDESLYLAFASGVVPEIDEDALKRSCVDYRSSLRAYLDQARVEEILTAASNKVRFSRESVDWRNFVQDVMSQLEPHASSVVEFKSEGMVDEVMFDDDDRIAELLTQAKDDISAEGVMRTGWQGINRMCGEHGGFRRGEFVLVGALQFNFKTGFTLNVFRHLAQYNKPHMFDPKKKPMLMHVSVENSQTDNILSIYQALKENETGQPCDIRNFTAEDLKIAATYVKDKMQANGYTINMCRLNPSDVTYQTLTDRVTYYESLGYEVHAVVFDYLNMISKKGCVLGGPAGSEIRELFRRTRNFMSA